MTSPSILVETNLQPLIKYEVRADKFRIGPPYLISQYEIVPPNMRFRSYFGYPEWVWKLIEAQGNSSGLGDLPVYCNEIVIDVDEDSEVGAVRRGLLQLGVFFMEYSANRGLHFAIPIYPVMGVNVVHSIKMWLLSWIEAEQIDMSMLHPSGQIRLAGSVHEKSGLKRSLLRTVPGSILMLEQKIRPPIYVRDATGVDDGIMRDWSNAQYTKALRVGQLSGNRYPYLFKFIKLGLDAGISGKVLLRDALLWNTLCKPPHNQYYIEDMVTRVMRH